MTLDCLCMDINPCDCTTECVLRRIDRERERKTLQAGDQRVQEPDAEAEAELQEARCGDEPPTSGEDHRYRAADQAEQ